MEGFERLSAARALLRGGLNLKGEDLIDQAIVEDEMKAEKKALEEFQIHYMSFLPCLLLAQ